MKVFDYNSTTYEKLLQSSASSLKPVSYLDVRDTCALPAQLSEDP